MSDKIEDVLKERDYLREELRRCRIRNLNLTFPKTETSAMPKPEAAVEPKPETVAEPVVDKTVKVIEQVTPPAVTPAATETKQN